MFKNPIKKYQSGGAAPSQEEQQMLQAFIEWLPKRVKEFANMQPEQIVEALNGMGKTPEGQKQVQAYMQQFQQELQGQQAGMFKDGGKLHNFICKHAKGGQVSGCGCKEDGGRVSKAQNGTSGIPQNASALDTYLMSNMQMPTSDNLFTGQQVANLINSIHLNQPLVQAQEDGGKVEMHQETNGGNGKIAVAREKYTPESYFKNRAAWLHLNNGDNYTEGRAYRPYAFGTPTAGFGGNDLEFHFVSEGLSGVPRRTVAVLNGYYDKNIPDNEVKKTFFDSEGNKNNSEDFNNRMNNLTEQMIQKMPARISYLRPSNGPDAILRENGGIVKGQNKPT